MSTSAPALAVSRLPRFGIVFDGGGGTNGLLNSVYLNIKSTSGQAVTLTNPLVLVVDVIGLNVNTTAQRSFTPGSSDGAIKRDPYNSSTRRRCLWTRPS